MALSDQRAKKEAEKETHRLFFAIEITEDVRASIHDVSTRLQKAAQFTRAKISWVPPENYHLTLFFLGNIEREKALKLAELLPEAVQDIAPFKLDIRHLGTFPKQERRPPKVLWVGSFNTPAMVHALRKNCARILVKAGLPVPDQDFSPHITLARFRSGAGLGAFRNMLKEYEHFKAGKALVTRLVLMESITGKGPARYTPFATAEFAIQAPKEEET